jgi:phosphonate transport system substrate-binding protein
MKRRLIISAAGLATAAPSLWAQDTVRRLASVKPAPLPTTLTFGLITPRNAEVTLKNWGPFLERMGAAAGVLVRARTYPTVSELIKDFVKGEVQLGWLGNSAALDIVESGTGSLFATKVVEGKAAYRSTLITHRDSPLRTLEDVHRQAPRLIFGDGDPKSTSGHVVPKYFAFAKRGINEPHKLFKEIRVGSHEKNLLAAARKEVDVATNNTTELDNFRNKQPQEAALIRVLWESPDIPESPMVWRNDLPAALKKKIAAFTYAFGTKDDEEKGILWNIDRLSAFRRTSNRQLVTIADLEMFNARQRIMNDPNLRPEERTLRVEEVTRRGSKLEMMLKSTSQASLAS